ncbi:MAG TPA: fructosamine kinase family protein [Ligilactobacillus acidipiscis]|uniref:Fructosamine kinase family protein n=1 Tax=Ligilactobacillus acidipiscis TaxID=89059 RepID=A0A921K1M8_9LACO|nr:fructosamine kinase family protein [Ligilactobacillus acidipiscis]
MDQTWIAQLPLSEISQIQPIAGGDVNLAYRVDTAKGPYFLLVQKGRAADFYAGEIAGLRALSAADVKAPRVIANGQIDGDVYLLLNYLVQGHRGSQAQLGRLVAKMHRYYSPNQKYGFSEAYQGASMTFENKWTDTWSELFVEQRMDQLRDALVDKHLWTNSALKKYEQVRSIIVDSLAQHKSKPSLLHGDFWGGNHMFLEDGQPALIDPSAFYGDREFDIGCSLVFGAYDQEFYSAYQEAYPMAAGYEKRLNFYSLYLLMIHLEKFGGMYASAVNNTMERIIAES